MPQTQRNPNRVSQYSCFPHFHWELFGSDETDCKLTWPLNLKHNSGDELPLSKCQATLTHCSSIYVSTPQRKLQLFSGLLNNEQHKRNSSLLKLHHSAALASVAARVWRLKVKTVSKQEHNVISPKACSHQDLCIFNNSCLKELVQNMTFKFRCSTDVTNTLDVNRRHWLSRSLVKSLPTRNFYYSTASPPNVSILVATNTTKPAIIDTWKMISDKFNTPFDFSVVSDRIL